MISNPCHVMAVSQLAPWKTYVDYPQVQADKARLEKSTASLRRAQEVAALSSTRLPRPDVGGFDNKCLSHCRLIAFSNDFFRCPHENIGEATRVQI